MNYFLIFFSLTIFLNASSDKENNIGEKIYRETCISCHGANGETNPQMNLIVKPRKLTKSILSKEQATAIIKDGAHYWGAHADFMPTFKYIYKDEQIQKVTEYIFSNFNPSRGKRVKALLKSSKEPSEIEEMKMLKVGKKIFKKTCSLCHGMSGNGKSIYVEESKKDKHFVYPYNLTKTLLDENQIFLFSKYGSAFWGADKNDMPSWKKRYSDIELKSIAKYVNEKLKIERD